MIVDNQVEAYNVPSGILFDMHRDAAARRPGVLTQVGIGTFVDPDQQGCAMNAAAAEHPVVRKETLRRPGVAVLPGHRAERRDHPCDNGRRTRQPDLRARRRAARRPRPGARSAQQRRHRHRPGQARRQGGQRCGRTTCTSRATWWTTSSSTRSVADDADRLRPGDQRRDPAAAGHLRVPGLGPGEGHRASRGAWSWHTARR